MIEIKTHHDGLGLNDLLVLTCDERDPNAGGCSHEYHGRITLMGGDGEADVADVADVLYVQFQHGARTKPDSTPGCLEGALFAILVDRAEAMQAGPFACEENALILAHLKAAWAISTHRAVRRKVQGVLGKDEKHKS